MPAHSKHLTDTFSEVIIPVTSIVAPKKHQSIVNLSTFPMFWKYLLNISSTWRSSNVCEPYLLNTDFFWSDLYLTVSALVQSLVNFCHDHCTICIKDLVIAFILKDEQNSPDQEECDRNT